MAKKKLIEPRRPLLTDFGSYLRRLRVDANVTMTHLAKELNLTTTIIRDIELNRHSPPSPERLRLWLKVLGQSGKYQVLKQLASRVKRKRTVNYRIRDEATEHLDRIIDAYENGRLLAVDVSLLKMCAIRESELDKEKRE